MKARAGAQTASGIGSRCRRSTLAPWGTSTHLLLLTFQCEIALPIPKTAASPKVAPPNKSDTPLRFRNQVLNSSGSGSRDQNTNRCCIRARSRICRHSQPILTKQFPEHGFLPCHSPIDAIIGSNCPAISARVLWQSCRISAAAICVGHFPPVACISPTAQASGHH